MITPELHKQETIGPAAQSEQSCAATINPYASPNSRIGIKTSLPDYAGKLYAPLSIAIACVFGGVLVAGLLIYSNYKNFEQSTASFITLFITTIATAVYLFAGLFVNQIPLVFLLLGVNSCIAILVLPFSMLLQGKQLEYHEDQGKPIYSSLRAAAIGVCCLFAQGFILTMVSYMFYIYSRG